MSDDTIQLSGLDLFDWVRTKGCEIIPLPEHKAKALLIRNPKNGKEAFLSLPINDKPVRDYTVYRICTRLCIEPPTCTSYLKEIHEEIEKTDHRLKSKSK